MSLTKIHHQLKNNDKYMPEWDVKHLFIGTFNPSGGEAVKYYYGRQKNQTWIILSEIFETTLETNSNDFFDKLKKLKIACVDMIDYVETSEAIVNEIIGQGYKDSRIINKNVRREYNTERINQVIANNPGIDIYSTWGTGPNLAEWKKEITKIGNIVPLKSPSLAARVPKGERKYQYMLNDWKKKIKMK